MARTELPVVVLNPDSPYNQVSGASVLVLNRSDLTSATVFAAETGGATNTQPLSTDAQGRVNGWLDLGAYVIRVTIPGHPAFDEPFDSSPANALISHQAATTSVHGISNTANLSTAADLAAHEADTTSIHGIPNTANLSTAADLAAHEADTTSIHGIANTANLSTTAALAAHEADTTAIHGITNTANLVDTAALAAHEADTTSIHGITNTADLMVKTLLDVKGDLIVATGDNVPARVGVGTNGQVLTADSAQSPGLKWATPSGGGGGSSLFINVKDSPYNAVGNGVANDAAAIQAALDACLAAGGGTVYLPPGTYKILTGLTYAGSNLHLYLDPNALVDFSGLATNGVGFEVSGSQTGVGVSGHEDLTANAAQNAASVSVTTASEFAAGDYVKLGTRGAISYPSTALFTPNTSADSSMDQRIGEIGVVASAASTTVTMRWPLLGGTYFTANTAFIAKLTMRENITVTGGKWKGGGTGKEHIGLHFLLCHRVRVENVHLENCDNKAIYVDDTINSHFEGITVIGGVSASASFYGVAFDFACQWGTVTNSVFRDVRHSTTCGGGGTTRSGINRFITVSNNHAYDTTESGFDSHAGAEHVTFTGNTSHSPIGQGIQVRCPKAIITNNTIRVPTGSGIYLRNQSDRDTEYLVEGNRISGSTNQGIYWTNPLESALAGTTAGQNIRNVTIVGNSVYGPGLEGIYAQSQATFDLDCLTITGNVVDTPTLVAFRLNDVIHAAVAGNVATKIPVNGTGFRIDDSTKCAITGNVCHGASTSGSFGIRSVNSDDLTLTGNSAALLGTGISLDNASDRCAVLGNNLNGCTTPLGPGSGTGHVYNTTHAGGAYNVL